MVYTNDLANLSLVLEGILLSRTFQDATALELIYKLVADKINYLSKPIAEKLLLPSFHLPYYEGFNKEGNVSWLGIYRRDELYPLPFLQELCEICLRTRIGEIYCSSWKSLVVKGIGSTERKTWDQLLGKYRINVRHAANELNWQVEDHCEDGLILKRHVIRYFDKEDVRTFGLCFAIQTMPSSCLFGSVLIRKQTRKNASRLKSNERFDILHTPDFNPNSTGHILFRAGVEKEQLGVYLVSLCKFFYEKETENMQPLQVRELQVFHEAKEDKPSKKLYQCTACLSVYDETLGDEENEVEPGTPFQQLSETFQCALCGSGKQDFMEIDENRLRWKEAGALNR
jgi:rubredoxin